METLYPTSVAEAVGALEEGVTPLAGGTDLMVAVNFGQSRPERVLALRRVEELTAWDGGRIGAGVTWRRIERAGTPVALAQAARTVGSPQIRNAGTLGGNVATASPAGDGLPFLAAVDADIEVRSSAGTRTVPWHEFFTGVKKTALRADELVTAVLLPDELPERQEFAKVGVRNAMVISIVSCVVTRTESGVTTVALGSVGPTCVRVPRAEQMISAEADPSPRALDEFARIVAEDISPISDHRSTGEYRRHAAGVVARRLLERCLRGRS
ncbi:xanthine dehydrogenase family protein subunit M [soil metagenome]